MPRLDSGQLETSLQGFWGTEQWYQHPFGILFTDGVKHFAEQGGEHGAYWWLDFVALHFKRYDRVFLELHIANSTAVVKAHDGNYNYFFEEEIPYTDMQEGVWHFYYMDNVLLLPGEY